MSRARLTPRALRDLDDIWAYSVERWDLIQAERYLRQIDAAIAMVSEDPRRGRPCDDIRPGYAQLSAGSHVLFFRKVSGGVEVVRILHGRMDFQRHL